VLIENSYFRFLHIFCREISSNKLKLLFVCDTNSIIAADRGISSEPTVAVEDSVNSLLSKDDNDGDIISPLERAMLAASAARFGGSSSTDSSTPAATPTTDDIAALLRSCKLNIQRKLRVNAGTNTARALASLPPNVLNPATYTALIRDMAAGKGWELSEWTMEELQSVGCGAFTAITQANGPNSSDRMLRLVRRAKERNTGTTLRIHLSLSLYLSGSTIFRSLFPFSGINPDALNSPFRQNTVTLDGLRADSEVSKNR